MSPMNKEAASSSPGPQRAAAGQYVHLARPLPPPIFQEPYAEWPDRQAAATLFHGRTLLFILVAVLVGAGLLSVAPDLPAAASATRRVPESTGLSSDSDGNQPPETGSVGLANAAAVSPNVPGSISPVFTPEVQHWAPKIQEWSKLHNLDPDIIATIMQIESCGDPGAASYAGAQGLFQVMPFHFDAGEDMLDPDTNADRGMAFYNRQLEYTGRDIYLSFAGYNGGYAASGSSYPYWASETQRYFTWAKGIYEEAKAGQSESPTLHRWLAAGGVEGCQRAAQRLGI